MKHYTVKITKHKADEDFTEQFSIKVKANSVDDARKKARKLYSQEYTPIAYFTGEIELI